MSQELLQHVQKSSKSLKKRIPPVKPGNTVRVHQKILESTKDGAKERIQIFEGLVIAVNSGSGTDATFTVRKIASGVGVEKTFPLHSSKIAQIEVIRHSKVRRAKLYFMRNRTGKSARLKEAKLMGYEFPEEEEEADEESIQEAVEAAKEAEEAEKGEDEGGKSEDAPEKPDNEPALEAAPEAAPESEEPATEEPVEPETAPTEAPETADEPAEQANETEEAPADEKPAEEEEK